MSEKSTPTLGSGFYKCLGVTDEQIINNLDMAVDLYTSTADSKSEEKARDFERAVGVFTVSYVRMVQEIFRNNISGLSPAQKYFVNFGALDCRLIPSTDIPQRLAAEKADGSQPSDQYEIYYLSEWLDEVSKGRIVSTTEAAQAKAKTTSEEEIEKLKDRMKHAEEELGEIGKKEAEEFEKLKCVFEKYTPTGVNRLKVLRAVRKQAADIETIIKDYNVKLADLEAIRGKLGAAASGSAEGADPKYPALKEEFDTVVQVIKSCAVRGGLLRSTPVLTDKWLAHETRLRVNTKENVAATLARFEELDPTIFLDKKGRRKAPRIVILPGVGTGMAWKDRIMLSLFSPPTMDADNSFVRILAGFRWYQATLSFNWKDLPGEIGSRYQVIYKDKTFNKLEKSFLDDYTAWMMKETLGYQTLNADVRKLFWKMIPFPKEKKEELSKRATIYRNLYKEDLSKGK